MKQKYLITSLLVILIGGILLSQWLGLWESESTKIPTLTATGEYDPGDIRGSYTFGDIEAVFEIEAEVLADVFGISTENPADFPLKDLEVIYEGLPDYLPELADVEIGTGSVRYFVTLATSIESELSVPEYIPLKALDYLLNNELIDQTTYEENLAIAINLSGYEQEYVATQETEEIEPLIKGKTTVQEVLDAGVPQEVLEEIIGMSITNRASLVKDLCTESGALFSEVKTQVDEYLLAH